MGEHGLHRALELRLDALADRIEALRQAMTKAKGAEEGEPQSRVGKRMADDLSSILENFTMRLDAKFLGGRQAFPEQK